MCRTNASRKIPIPLEDLNTAALVQRESTYSDETKWRKEYGDDGEDEDILVLASTSSGFLYRGSVEKLGMS
jgi:hypothetical protein